MAYSTRLNRSNRPSGNHYEGSLERNGYQKKKFSEQENLENDPIAKYYATKEGVYLGYDVIVRYDASQEQHPEWVDMAKRIIKAGGTLKEVKEGNDTGWYDVIWMEDGQVVEKLDVGRRQ